MLDDETEQFTAVVLAADRNANDPVTVATGVACKAFAPVRNKTMIIRVIEALEASDRIGHILICGPSESLLPQCPELLHRLENDNISWVPNRDSPGASAASCLQRLTDDTPVLLTTADHALLTPDIVRYFVDESRRRDADATLGVVDSEIIERAYPGTRRTVTRLRDGDYCGCNLYALLNHNGREVIGWWRSAEQQRKHPRKWIAKLLGPITVITYLLGRLTLERGMAIISNKVGVRLQAVLLPYPRAGIDVDKVEDLRLAETILNSEEKTALNEQAHSQG